jgi:tellurite resistance protein
VTNRYASAKTATAELAADYADYRDKEVMQALVTAGALVALADGHREDVERDELVGFIHRQDFAPTISQRGIAKAFHNHVRELQENYNPNVVIEALRPLAGLSLTSVVVRTAERVAAADRKIHPSEEKAISLIRLIMMSLPANKSLAVLSLSADAWRPGLRPLTPTPDPEFLP